MIVDAHQHLWELSRFPQDWLIPDYAAIHRDFGPHELMTIASAHVDKTVLVQTVHATEETLALLDYAAATPLIGSVVGWVDLTTADVSEQLKAIQSLPNGHLLTAVRHQVQGEADPNWLCRPDVRRGLQAVAAQGLAYDLLTLPHQLPAAIETAAAIPELQFVVDHISKPDIARPDTRPQWEKALRRLASHPNVACKLSGLVTQAVWTDWTVEDIKPFACAAIDAFGPDRLMFGSDWPVCLVAAPYEATLELVYAVTDNLTHDERTAIVGDTAASIYRIDEGS